MKVLHIVAGNLFGGIEQMLVALARERRHAPDMESRFAVCFEGRLSRALGEVGATTHLLGEVRCSRPWTVGRACGKLRQLLGSEPWDVVVCHSAWSQAIFGAVAPDFGAAQVFWLHDVPSKFHWLEMWASLRPPDLAICNSRFTASHLSRVFPRCPSVIVSYPVSGEGSLGAPQVAGGLARQEGMVTILHATRMDAGKGHRVLLDALSRIASIPGWRCWFAGGAQRPSEVRYAEEIHRRSAALGLSSKVTFLGFREDAASLMCLADIYCQPNERPEPFGIAFIEALGRGLPVVTSAFGGAVEIVDQTCGRLVPPGDAQELAAVLASLIRDGELRRTLASAGTPRAHVLCDPQKQMQELRTALAAVAR
jgi:glycosyltransferase involved in cell wall biosynthesis